MRHSTFTYSIILSSTIKIFLTVALKNENEVKCGSADIISKQRLPELSLRIDLGPVVQSIVGLTSSLRGQLVKYFTTM